MNTQDERSEQRHSDIILAELSTRFNEFISRYERDIAFGTEWKKDTTERLRVHCEFVRRVSPIYERMMWFFGVVTTIIVGLFVTLTFKHIHWQ